VITVAEALSLIGELEPLGTESVPVGEAAGRVLAQEIRADRDWPPFETSAMDGYAVRLADVPASGTTLSERSRLVAAGDAPPAAIAAGEAVRVMTGAPLPENTEAVIPVEQARREQGRVRFEAVPAPGAHLRRRGEILSAGASLLPQGRRLASSDLALVAFAGADPVSVFRRPRIAISVTGNEIVPPSSAPAPGQLRDTNGPMLAGLCRARGWTPTAAGRVADDARSVERLFTEAGRGEDLLVTTGGVSAGDLDLLPSAAAKAGFEILFHKVSIRPGKPVAFGRREATFWLGLPGNPVSAAVCFHLFGRELVGRLEGEADPALPRITARLTLPLPATGPRETYHDALWSVFDGESRVEPLASKGSHDIGAYARANALLRVPAGSPRLQAGSLVECLLVGPAQGLP